MLRVSKIQAHCFTEAGDCCPYIAIYATDTFLAKRQSSSRRRLRRNGYGARNGSPRFEDGEKKKKTRRNGRLAAVGVRWIWWRIWR